jgi:hypothetical protein
LQQQHSQKQHAPFLAQHQEQELLSQQLQLQQSVASQQAQSSRQQRSRTLQLQRAREPRQPASHLQQQQHAPFSRRSISSSNIDLGANLHHQWIKIVFSNALSTISA